MALAAHDATASKVDTTTHNVNDFAFRGSHILKGVWHARAYPVFAIDRESNDAVNTAVSALNGESMEASQIIDVCHACHQDDRWPFRLYLPESPKDTFRQVPPNAMASLLLAEQSLEGAETQPPNNGDDPLEGNPPLG